MNRMILGSLAVFFASSAAASGVYNGFAAGNPDLFEDSVAKDEITAVQPAVGGGVDIYGSFSGNPDLFTSPEGSGIGKHSGDTAIYGGFESGNPDLR